MSNDRLMIRGESAGSFNLAVGEPVFLQESSWYTGHQLLMDAADPRYPAFGGDEKLIELIRQTNKNVKKHVIITNGAKQALLAALYAFKNEGVKYHRDWAAFFERPYWPSYPTLLQLVGIHRSYFSQQNDIKIITSPNNPDGAESVAECDIWDAAYFHYMYGAKAVPNHTVSVWSMAKLYGLSGARVGYASTDDDVLADKMREYVEITTSGVSNDSQKHIARVLELQLRNPEYMASQYTLAARTLAMNASAFNFYISPYLVENQGRTSWTGRGMFAWVKFGDPTLAEEALEAAKVKAIPGRACGASFGEGWYRFSMGHKTQYTEQACEALAKVLRSSGIPKTTP